MALYERLSYSPTELFIEEQSRLKQFHGIADRTLFRLAELASGFAVEDRWVAIALIMRNPLPIPVPGKSGDAAHRSEPATPAKLELIEGGNRGAKAKAASAGRLR